MENYQKHYIICYYESDRESLEIISHTFTRNRPHKPEKKCANKKCNENYSSTQWNIHTDFWKFRINKMWQIWHSTPTNMQSFSCSNRNYWPQYLGCIYLYDIIFPAPKKIIVKIPIKRHTQTQCSLKCKFQCKKKKTNERLNEENKKIVTCDVSQKWCVFKLCFFFYLFHSSHAMPLFYYMMYVNRSSLRTFAPFRRRTRQLCM